MTRQQLKLSKVVKFACDLAELSTCKRKHNAAIVVPPNFGEVYAVGYNGPALGESNDRCSSGEGTCGCVHAEVNACLKLGRRERSGILFATTSPCMLCAGAILNTRLTGKGIWVVAYRDKYRDLDGVQRLTDAGLAVFQVAELLHDDGSRLHEAVAYAEAR